MVFNDDAGNNNDENDEHNLDDENDEDDVEKGLRRALNAI